eukprot:GEMP01069215.1.p1 GENE.GEMP01069215.1~~GEMP01069215.1.p1  ORF type:complete len:329 (-),score=41.54 GEMP01069215.1:183-1169(-)
MKIKVVTYNILAASLAPPARFPACRPEHLDPEARFKKILKKLELQVMARAIVCLQEISLQWTGPLTQFFHNNDYHFIYSNYGRRFSDYMGIGIAYPQTFKTVDVKLETIYDPQQKEEKPSLIRSLLQLVTTAPEDPWKLALRQNRIVMVSLEEPESKQTFTIATYHMPCLFGSEERRAAVSVHTAYTLKAIEEFCAGQPRVFCGDFNFSPSAAAYGLVTDAKLVADIPPEQGDKRLPTTEPMRSAYALAGGEPKFTNYAQVEDQPIFAETLDYIFISPEWEVTAVEELMDPTMQEMLGPNPTEDEPSDHYLIGAELKIAQKVLQEGLS